MCIISKLISIRGLLVYITSVVLDLNFSSSNCFFTSSIYFFLFNVLSARFDAASLEPKSLLLWPNDNVSTQSMLCLSHLGALTPDLKCRLLTKPLSYWVSRSALLVAVSHRRRLSAVSSFCLFPWCIIMAGMLKLKTETEETYRTDVLPVTDSFSYSMCFFDFLAVVKPHDSIKL